MHINAAGLELIKTFEGFSPTPYICPAGIRTIYYGHICRAWESYDGTREQGEAYLRQDLTVAEDAVPRLIKVHLTENQFSALVSFVFNLGSGSLQRSTLRSKLNRREYMSASGEFEKWVYAAGKKLSGLVARRECERKLFLS